MVDLDPRWVIKLVKSGDPQAVEGYKRHVIDQALTLLKAHDSIQCLFTTPKLLEALCERISLKRASARVSSDSFLVTARNACASEGLGPAVRNRVWRHSLAAS